MIGEDSTSRKMYQKVIEEKDVVGRRNRGGIRDCFVGPAILKSSCMSERFAGTTSST